jgi:uncharacterized protein YkwD
VPGGTRVSASTTQRRAAYAAVLLFSALIAALLVATSVNAQTTRLTQSEQAFLIAVNRARAERALPPVTLDANLVRAARTHSAEMVRRGVFGHGDFVRRLFQFGADGPIVGEDLGWTVDDAEAPGRVVSWWLRSPRHRAVLLRRGFRQVGVGVARGTFLGRQRCVVVTADFQGR